MKILKNHRSQLADLVSVLMVFLLVYTGVSKFQHLSVFTSQLRETRLYNGVEPLLSWTVPSAEILVALLLIVPATRRTGLLLSALLLSLFTGHLLLVITGNGSQPCSCGGVLGSLSWTQHLALNSVLLVFCYGAYFIRPRLSGRAAIKPDPPVPS